MLNLSYLLIPCCYTGFISISYAALQYQIGLLAIASGTYIDLINKYEFSANKKAPINGAFSVKRLLVTN